MLAFYVSPSSIKDDMELLNSPLSMPYLLITSTPSLSCARVFLYITTSERDLAHGLSTATYCVPIHAYLLTSNMIHRMPSQGSSTVLSHQSIVSSTPCLHTVLHHFIIESSPCCFSTRDHVYRTHILKLYSSFLSARSYINTGA